MSDGNGHHYHNHLDDTDSEKNVKNIFEKHTHIN